jgi:protein-disulfide isomerase
MHPAVRSRLWWHRIVLAASVGIALSACIGKRRPQAKDEQQASKDTTEGGGKLLQPGDVDDKLKDIVTGDRVQALYDESDAWKGARNPLVTIVEYSDFQCPFCSRLASSLEEVVTEYPNDVRLVFKHFPLPNHANAAPAARATVAAQEQDKFWPLHDLLFANQRTLEPSNIEAYAQKAELDLDKWKARMAVPEVQQQVADDEAAARALDIRSTPTFFVNGKKFEGAQPVEQIKAIVEEERKLALQLIEAGSKREEIYARIMRAAKPGAAAPAPPAAAAKAPEAAQGKIMEADLQLQFAVPIGQGTPRRGPEDAIVTVIEFGSLTAEASQKNRPMLAALAEKYPDVQWVYRHLPLDDAKAGRAARAAIAAHRQGKFWEMREALLTNTGELDPANLSELAKKAGLDEAKFRKDLQDASLGDPIINDAKVAEIVRGTATAPIFFINGRTLTGTPSMQDFEKVIGEERKKAEQWMLAQGEKKGPDLYARMAQSWRAHSQFQAVGGSP